MDISGAAIDGAGVAIDSVNGGGSFPVAYPGVEPPPLGAFMADTEDGFERPGLPGARLWAEPGPAWRYDLSHGKPCGGCGGGRPVRPRPGA